MGWKITLKANRPIFNEDIQAVIDNLPEDLQGAGFPDQTWGWLAATDIYYPEGNELEIAGSYTQSGHKAELMAQTLKMGLEKLGYTIEVGALE